jgi:hypothetical protein
MQTLVITSASQISHLLNSKPALLTIPAFNSLNVLSKQVTTPSKGGCKTCGGNKVNPYAQLRPQMENALNSLTPEDFLKMKSILGIDKLCYYRKNINTKKLEQTCL